MTALGLGVATNPRAMALIRLAILGLLGGILLTVVVSSGISIISDGDFGLDAAYDRDLGARFLADGSYYLPRQLAGPYDVELGADVLYPPSALLLFVPAAIVPAPFWWIVPIVITGYAFAVWRPKWWGVAAMLALLIWPRAHAAFFFGNTDMWAMAAIAAGLLWGWPAVLLALKPIFAPFAIVGIRHRSWWIAVAAMAVFVALTLPLWLQYVTVIRNLRVGSDYSFGSIPLLLVPIVVWWSRTSAGGAEGSPTAPDHRVAFDSGPASV